MQRVYGTLKQNLVKFKYTQVNNEEFKPSRSHQIAQDANLWLSSKQIHLPYNFLQIYLKKNLGWYILAGTIV